MPPADEPQPSLEELETMTGWIENDFLAAQCGQDSSPAPVVIRRLNRQEYDNTVRDLLGIDLNLADSLPAGRHRVRLRQRRLGAQHLARPCREVPRRRRARPPEGDRPARRRGVPPRRADRPEHLSAPARQGGRVRTLPQARAIPGRFQPGAGGHRGDRPRRRGWWSGSARTVAPWTPSASRTRRSSTATGSRSPRGTSGSMSRWPRGRPRIRTSVKPEGVAANVSGDQRYGGDRGLHVDSMVVRGPVPLKADGLPESHRRILFRTPGLRR